ncbi:cytidine deaminase [candidate division WOR-1 bacterium RIFOXYA2_FULL_36_21]|uniref:Cytidine deaminase n=1 Tax=candidate division WOR-1 bacterium RIFOXYB2_FULL_36_35 TaxID=1802578 RepID=A0A1F4RYD0_UNCSA|nr:MAG: cytidine deaminase [candidate division WOR-1 bacterium RIFOXYA2_FULL_36_21]OGC13157.1 MAG: cytidine deaminase [candidate division WOR-1 bacterium RIFOXYB2_FULL_36_35]OGC18599.1 MAG: cytidine deaminase [candidate division WOR-1 bacterium RIFOXYA12_FULL_36_13]
MSKRPSWDDYFMKITQDVSTRATCVKRKVGAIIVKENRILATGYNGAPKDFSHCTSSTCIRKKLKVPSGQRHELCRGLHAEQNAIIQASVYGVKIEGGILYCTYQPCVICVKMMINAGIIRLVYSGGYPDKLALQMLKESKIKTIQIS